jgi:hypothetical protein
LATLRLLLVTLTLLRLLLPPGICVCKLTSPAARLLTTLLATKPPVLPPSPSTEPEDDHAPGCPASFLSLGLYVKPAEAPARPPLTFDHPPVPDPVLAWGESLFPATEPASSLALLDLFPRPPDAAVWLTVCSLRI